MTGRAGLLILLALGGSLLAATALGADALSRWQHGRVVEIALVSAVIYAVAVWVLLRSKAAGGRALAGILIVAALMRALVLFEPPVSTDIFRYVWDGRVQAAGINPYLHVPADAALAHLRDAAIYPYINRKEYAPTIYPPTAQLIFWAVTRVSETVTAMKAAMVAFEALGMWAILRLLAARGLPSTRVLLYAWHPLPVYEFAGSGHVDAIAIGLMLLAFWAADRGRPVLAGVALAAGGIAKYFPVVQGPVLWRRWNPRLPIAFLVTAAVLYLPYASAGPKLLGFLGGYVAEGGLDDGAGVWPWAALRLAVPLPQGAFVAYMPIVAGVLGIIALRAFLSDGPKPDLRAGMTLALAFTFLFSPHHAWYFAWLIPFLCFVPSPAVIYLTGASSALLRLDWPPDVGSGALLYGPFIVLLLIELGRRWTDTKEKNYANARVREPAAQPATLLRARRGGARTGRQGRSGLPLS